MNKIVKSQSDLNTDIEKIVKITENGEYNIIVHREIKGFGFAITFENYGFNKLLQKINFVELYNVVKNGKIKTFSFNFQKLEHWDMDQFENFCWFLENINCDNIELYELVFFRISNKRANMFLKALTNVNFKRIHVVNLFVSSEFEQKLVKFILNSKNITELCLDYNSFLRLDMKDLQPIHNTNIFVICDNAKYYSVIEPNYSSNFKINECLVEKIVMIIDNIYNLKFEVNSGIFRKLSSIISNKITIQYKNKLYRHDEINNFLLNFTNSRNLTLTNKFFVNSWYITDDNILNNSTYLYDDDIDKIKIIIIFEINKIYVNLENRYLKRKNESQIINTTYTNISVIMKKILILLMILKRKLISHDILFIIFEKYLYKEKLDLI